MKKPSFRFWIGFLTGLLGAVGANILISKLQTRREKQNKQTTSTLIKQNGKAFEPVVYTPHNFISKKINHERHFSWRRFFREKPAAIGILSLVVLSFLFQGTLQRYSFFFKASLTDLEPITFTGTVSPVQKVPDWVNLTDAERKMTYDQLPTSKLIPIPAYNVSAMKKGMVWAPDNGKERNTYITYPVPYMGNYQLDATENSGSHLGIDIKIPIGTPIHAIANGFVYKAEDQPTGFGQHIVIAHVGIPDPENPKKKVTLFSVYGHLSKILVKVGDQVTKDQVIAKSGNSGMATAPHLHFQIERDTASFHAYWPFSWKDLQAASISSYFDGVAKGVGKANAIANTVNPIAFTNEFSKYTDDAPLVATAGESTDSDDTSTKTTSKTTASETKTEVAKITTQETTQIAAKTETIQTTKTSTATDAKLEIQTDRVFVPGEEKKIKLVTADPVLVASAGIELSSTLRDMAQITPSKLTADDFKDGIAQITVKTDSDSSFKIVATGDFGEVKSDSLRAQVFKDVPASNKFSEAIQYLKSENIVNGYADGTFKPDGTLNRAEAVKILIIANKVADTDSNAGFQDVPSTAWFSGYVKTAFANGIVKGYGDGSFRPENQVTRAEFLKMAIATAGIEIPEISSNPYDDVSSDDWFGKYFAFAKTQNLIDAKRGGYMAPQSEITRAEAAQIIWKLSELKK